MSADEGPFSVAAQAASLRRTVPDWQQISSYTLGAIEAFAGKEAFSGDSPAKRLAYIRNALAAAEIVRAELKEGGALKAPYRESSD